MKYYQQIQLNNGKPCVLRSPSSEDAAEWRRHLHQTASETEYLFRYPDEYTNTEAEDGVYLRDIEASANKLMLVAVVDGKIVADAGFDPASQLQKTRHRAVLGISVQKEYWGCGIGIHMMAAILKMARHTGYEQLELEVVSDNERAVALYDKFGFNVVGKHERALRCRDGQYQSLTTMVCML